MTEKSFMTVEEVAAELRVSKSKAYQIVRELNAEMQKQGYLTVAGRVNATFFHKKVCYSEEEGVDLDGCIQGQCHGDVAGYLPLYQLERGEKADTKERFCNKERSAGVGA